MQIQNVIRICTSKYAVWQAWTSLNYFFFNLKKTDFGILFCRCNDSLRNAAESLSRFFIKAGPFTINSTCRSGKSSGLNWRTGWPVISFALFVKVGELVTEAPGRNDSAASAEPTLTLDGSGDGWRLGGQNFQGKWWTFMTFSWNSDMKKKRTKPVEANWKEQLIGKNNKKIIGTWSCYVLIL